MKISANPGAHDVYLDLGIFELATVVYGLWQLRDAPFHAALEQAIRAYVQRHPEFTTMLEKTLWCSSPVQRQRQTVSETTRHLYALWHLADPPLRADAEALIRTYSQRHPHSVTLFHTLLANHEHLVQRRTRP